MRPESIWYLSTRAYAKGWKAPAAVLKLVNYLAFRAVLPYEVTVSRDVVLWHRGLGTVVHPNVVIGRGVRIAHGVTISGTPSGISIIEDNVTVAAGAIVLPRRMEAYRIGAGAIIGAGAVSVGDVPASAVVRGPRSTINEKGQDEARGDAGDQSAVTSDS